MAQYYFDNTSPIANAGFGAMTGNWSDSKWVTSNAGTDAVGNPWPGIGNEAFFGSAISAASAGTITTAGTIQLDGFNCYSSTAVQTWNFTGGTFDFGSASATLGSTGGTGLQVRISTIIAGTNALTKVGTGRIFLLANNTFTGTITNNVGTLYAGDATTTGTFGAASANIVANSTTIVSRTNDYTISGNISGSNLFRKTAGAGKLILSGSTISVTTLDHLDGTIEFNNPNQAISSLISGTASIIFSATGLGAIATLSGGSTNTGAWSVNSGTLAISTTAIGATAGLVTIGNGATLTASVGFGKSVSVASGGTLTLNAASSISSGSLTINPGSTAYIGAGYAGTSSTITINGTGASFGSGILNWSNGTFVVGSVAGNTTFTIPTGYTIYGTTGTHRIVNAAGAQVAIYSTGGVFGTASGGVAFNVGAFADATSYFYYNGTSGTIGTNISQAVYLGGSASTSGCTTAIEFNGATFGAGVSSTIFGSSSVSNSTFTVTSSVSPGAVIIGGSLASGAVDRQQVLTVSGATFTAGTLAMSATASGTDAGTALNIIGGGSASFTTGTMTGGANKRINLNNGTLAFSGAVTGGSIYLYGAGNVINGSSSIATPILDPVGNGITGIEYAVDGTGYIGAPVVTITGGDGTGATARASFDKATGVVSKTLIITNPGTGYSNTPSAPLIVTLTGGGASAVAPSGSPTITRAAPTLSTSFSKTNAGTMTLTGTNTFTGQLNITASGGVVSIGNASAAGTLGLNDTSPVAISTGATLNFNRNDSPVYSNLLSGLGGISKTSGLAGTFTTLSTANLFTGSVTVTSGALRATHADAVGTGSGSVAVASGASFEISGGIALNSNRGVTIAGTGLGGLGALRNVSGDNTISGALAVSGATPTIGSDAGTLTLSNVATTALGANALSLIGVGDIDLSPVFSGTATVTKTSGTGTAILRGSSTYTGKTTVSAGTLGYTTAAGSGGASSFGAPTLAASLIVDVAGGATVGASAGVRFVGTTDQTFSRTINVTGTNAAGLTVRIEASSNTAKVTHSTAITNTTANQPRTYQFGGTGTADNTVSYIIANNGSTTNTVSVVKDASGKWLHTNNNTYTGTLAVNGGTLTLSGTNTPSAVSVSNAGTVLVASSPTGAARFGTTTVTVNAAAKIQTLTGSGQIGRHTYNNLTFAAGGRIRIGG